MAATLLVAVPAQAATGAGSSPELVVPADPVVLAGAVEPVELVVPGAAAAAHRISESGVVAGDATLDGGALRVFRWQDGTADVLTDVDVDSSAVDVNEAGQVLVQTYRPDGSAGALLWQPDGSVVDLAPEPLTAYGWDLDDAGRVALDLTDPGEWQTHAAVWQDGTLTRLDDRGGASYVGENGALNGRGEVVGTVVTDAGSRAVVWRDGVPQDLVLPQGAESFAAGVNEHGDILGTVQKDALTRAVVWEKGQLLRYLVHGQVERQRFYDLNEHGVAVGSVGDTRESMQAALADRRTTAFLPTLGGPTGTAYAVNDDGVVVGASTLDADAAYGHAVAWVRGAAVPLSGRVDDVAPVNSAALDVDEQGRAVGYVQRRDAGGGLGFDTRAVLWELTSTVSRS